MKKKISEILWLALVYAKQDRQSFIDAYHNDMSESVVREAAQEIKDFERLQIKLFGTTKTELQAAMEKMTPKSIIKMMASEMEKK